MPAEGARIIGSPRHGKAGIDLDLCAAGGRQHRHIARRAAAAYKAARKLEWGDWIGPPQEDVP
jgi:ribosomal protein RSM22 (predicted rRNA methylase)